MIKIVSFKICPFVQRVTAMLEAKGIPYEVEYISLGNKPQWFLDNSPNGQVPVLITDSGEALFESDAIVEYIDDISTPLEGAISPEQRARNRAWSYQAAKHYLPQCSAMRSEDESTLAERAEKLGADFARAEAAFGDGPFFNGSTLGNVDLAWLVLLHRTDIIRRHSGYDFLADFSKLRQWRKGLLATGLAEKSVAEGFEQTFVAFYLSPKTALGQRALGEQAADNCCRKAACC